MDSNYLSRLVHPLYKTPLRYDESSGMLTDGQHDDRYEIKDNVPVLLTKTEQPELTETKAHANAGTTFNYKEHYQVDAQTYDYFKTADTGSERSEHTRLHQHIISQIKPDAQWILDTGCGGGWLATALKGKGKSVISMDISDLNPLRATKDVPYSTHYGLVADVFELPVKEGSIDCIVASEIIEHVSDPRRFVQSLFTALKPGGRLIITTPYNERIQQSLCIHCNQLTPHNAHLHSFTETNILACVPKGAASHKTKVFNNKVLVRLGIQNLLGFLPLSLWTVFDKIANALTGKRAYRLMLVIDK